MVLQPYGIVDKAGDAVDAETRETAAKARLLADLAAQETEEEKKRADKAALDDSEIVDMGAARNIRALLDYLEPQASSKGPGPVLAVHHGSRPLDTRESSRELWMLGFAHLFYDDRALPYHKDRRVPITFHEWFTHLIDSCHPQFREDQEFLFYCHDLIQRGRVSRSTRAMIKRTGHETHKLLASVTTEELREAHLAAVKRIPYHGPVRTVMNKVKSITRQV